MIQTKSNYMKNKKYGEEVFYIHSSENDKISEIALCMKQKLDEGSFLPDYEVTQNMFSYFGDTMYVNKGTYKESENETVPHYFESTYNIDKELNNDYWYITINVNSRYLNGVRSREKKPYWYLNPEEFGMKINTEGMSASDIEVYDPREDDWFLIHDTSYYESGIKLNRHCFLIHHSEYTFLFRVTTVDIDEFYGGSIDSFITTFTKHLHVYNSFVLEEKYRGLIFSYKKQWYFTNCSATDVRVKHGCMEYKNGLETAWAVSSKWTKRRGKHQNRGTRGFMYRGRCNFRYGGSVIHLHYNKKRKYSWGWHHYTDAQKNIFDVAGIQNKSDWAYIYLIKLIDRRPCLIKQVVKDVDEGKKLTPNGGRQIFERWLSIDEYYGIYRKKFFKPKNNSTSPIEGEE